MLVTIRSLCLVLCLCASQWCWGRDLHVDPDIGDDRHDGITAPVKTITRGIQLAEPGDTVHLKSAVYRDFASFADRHGEPDRPIVLDGHGAVLEGSEPIDPATWIEESPGRFRNDQLVPRLNASMMQRWFFLWDGKMNHMGRTSKGTRAPFKAPSELQAGEWTFVEWQEVPGLSKGQIAGTFYVQLPPGQSLADAKIAYPVRANGVQLGGRNSHLVIRNIIATHVGNDGFNIHGDCHDVLFENICAIECGDDGISAHETARYRVEGFVSIGNSTGICDTVASQTSYNQVCIRDCLAYDLFFLDQGQYSVRNAVIHSRSEYPLSVRGRADAESPCRLELENVTIIRQESKASITISKNAELTARGCRLVNVDIVNLGGTVNWTDELVTERQAIEFPDQCLGTGNQLSP